MKKKKSKNPQPHRYTNNTLDNFTMNGVYVPAQSAVIYGVLYANGNGTYYTTDPIPIELDESFED